MAESQEHVIQGDDDAVIPVEGAYLNYTLRTPVTPSTPAFPLDDYPAAGEAETATMYTAEALANEMERATTRSKFHSISIGGRDPLANFAALIKQSDYAIGNLECPVATVGTALDSKIFTFRAKPETLVAATTSIQGTGRLVVHLMEKHVPGAKFKFVTFKGGGFYKTDSRGGSSSSGAVSHSCNSARTFTAFAQSASSSRASAFAAARSLKA